MDPLHSKAQRQIDAASAKSKGSSSRKSKRKKRSTNQSQNAGQPSGPSRSVSTSERSRSRAAVHPADEEAAVPSSRSSSGGPSRGAQCASYTVGALHAIDIGLGLALVVYGAMVHVSSVTAAAVCYGLLLLLGGAAGAIGYYSEGCNRRGLRGSAIAGFLAMLLDIGAFIAIIVGWDSFVKFLNDNHEALLLTKDAVKTIDGLKILFAVIFLVLAGLEGHRALAMWSMKDALQSRGTSRGSSRSSSSGSSKAGCCEKCLSFFGLSKRKKTDDFVVFDDNASMESSLLWSKNEATSDDYLEFVPEHERGLANFATSVGLPRPPEDRVDY